MRTGKSRSPAEWKLQLTATSSDRSRTAPLSSSFKHFEDTIQKEIDDVLALKALFPIKLTNALLPAMQGSQKLALVLTCGSQAYIGTPYVSAYSATKGALHSWNRALAAEQHETKSKVEILEVVIGGTYTSLVAQDPSMKAGLFMPTAEVMAKSILARVGNGHRIVTAYFWHGVQLFLIYSFPMSVAGSIMAGVLKPSVEPKKAK
ncbi:hypothetical protein BU23DRAFT_569491 [Bimuria novae-zelandiae CBS 107.79]|uniref:NAD(P)-binding protein n=1 Tax=Bimuria novae-zelandiae CBS 107.79 TaxID=1447943 RepID=A0A6A5V4N8_9PLEO|nr:hypothetical protein BU23DRAFT_569491 [Bimuria novae-zelandiae CBS 107.79]